MAKEMNRNQERIVRDPDIMVGKPVVRGTRITVEAVLAHLADNPDIKDLFEAYPRLTLDDLKACMAFAEGQVKKTRKVRPAGPPPQPAAL